MDIDKIVDNIKNGKVGIIPTDTVYGLVGDSSNEDVIKRIYDIKERDYSKPLLILVSDTYMLRKYVTITNEVEDRLVNRYWPGKMTLILKKKDTLNDLITGGKDTVGVRIPDNDDLRDIIRMVGRPIISTSANISGNETIINIKDIDKKLANKVDFIEDGGTLEASASTIVSAFNKEFKILRKGDMAAELKKEFQ